jgi:hypothetical protein
VVAVISMVILECEGGTSTTIAIAITMHAIVCQIVHTAHVVARESPYDGTETREMSVTLKGEIVRTEDSCKENMTRTLVPLARRNLGHVGPTRIVVASA